MNFDELEFASFVCYVEFIVCNGLIDADRVNIIYIVGLLN